METGVEVGMIDSELVNRARDFAKKKHEGQTRKDGSPYFAHLVRTAEIVFEFKKCTRIEELLSATFLHDVLEDTDTGISELRENFGEIITLVVVELTTDNLRVKIDGKADYLSNKFSNDRAISNWALVIKLADRLDNISDLNERSIEFAQRMKRETIVILDALEKNRELTPTQEKLVAAIREKLSGVNV